MKIGNEEVSIRIGNQEKTFKNMILNNYLNLFADSFLEFKNKDLPYCYVNFSNYKNNINEDSTEMAYDMILETNLDKNVEILGSNSVINKYYYRNSLAGELTWDDFRGRTIIDIGFGNYDNQLGKFVLYAYIDVSKYNIVVQDLQPIVISRVDKITSDMKMWTRNKKIKAPIHLTTRGILELKGFEYETIVTKLYSVGFGVVPYQLNQEYLVENLNFTRNATGKINIQENLIAEHLNSLYMSNSLYMKSDLYMQKPSYQFIIYKFKLYKIEYSEQGQKNYVDTGMYYTQYSELKKHGKINLSIKYERS